MSDAREWEMPKILTVSTCDDCPHFGVDLNFEDGGAEFWGLPSCRHPDVGLRSLPSSSFRGTEWKIPQWCPLPDAAVGG